MDSHQLDAPTHTDRLDGDFRIRDSPPSCERCAGRTYYTVDEVARLLRIGRTSLYENYLGRQLPVVRFGKSVRIAAADLARFCQAHRSEPSDGA